MRRFLVLVLALLMLACGTRSAPTPQAPIHRPAIEQIPVDLDVVLRADLTRLRENLDPMIADAVGRLLVSQARAPSDLLVAALAKTDKLWLGVRPDADPRRWDNVVILEGDFSAIATEEITRVFGPPRDLGGGFRAYDVPTPGARTAPARLYTYLEKRWLLASTAEVDALERVIERHRSERTLEPPDRGVISLAANLSRVSASFKESSPRVAEFVGSAESVTGFASASGSGFEGEVRVQFTDVDAAKRASLALGLVLRFMTPPDVSVDVQVAERDVVVSAKISPEALGRALSQ